nr:DDE-type integrase/transposase/recombinase [Methylotenera sp.]
RQFSAPSPNQVWVGDMTFIRTRQGWLHLAVLLDLYSRKVVGWSMGAKADTALHQAALRMAVTQRNPSAGSFIIPTVGGCIVMHGIVQHSQNKPWCKA